MNEKKINVHFVDVNSPFLEAFKEAQRQSLAEKQEEAEEYRKEAAFHQRKLKALQKINNVICGLTELREDLSYGPDNHLLITLGQLHLLKARVEELKKSQQGQRDCLMPCSGSSLVSEVLHGN